MFLKTRFLLWVTHFFPLLWLSCTIASSFLLYWFSVHDHLLLRCSSIAPLFLRWCPAHHSASLRWSLCNALVVPRRSTSPYMLLFCLTVLVSFPLFSLFTSFTRHSFIVVVGNDMNLHIVRFIGLWEWFLRYRTHWVRSE